MKQKTRWLLGVGILLGVVGLLALSGSIGTVVGSESDAQTSELHTEQCSDYQFGPEADANASDRPADRMVEDCPIASGPHNHSTGDWEDGHHHAGEYGPHHAGAHGPHHAGEYGPHHSVTDGEYDPRVTADDADRSQDAWVHGPQWAGQDGDADSPAFDDRDRRGTVDESTDPRRGGPCH